jgi:hypothetical protein
MTWQIAMRKGTEKIAEGRQVFFFFLCFVLPYALPLTSPMDVTVSLQTERKKEER